MNSARLKILLFILLSLATLYSAKVIAQYHDISQQLLSNADFSAELSQWKSYKAVDTPITINNNELFLSSPATDRSVVDL